ncbi:MAG: hypothetical protein L3J30_02795 [Marinosulfonomonas sp.]|nr:hypothetical protein [Marinosulfonomonas sp.]
MKIAAAACPIDGHDNWASYEAKITEWVAEATREGVRGGAFPDHGAQVLWKTVVPMNAGATADSGSPDAGVPDTGAIVEAEMNIAGWIYGDVSLERSVRCACGGGACAQCHPLERATRPCRYGHYYGDEGECLLKIYRQRRI